MDAIATFAAGLNAFANALAPLRAPRAGQPGYEPMQPRQLFVDLSDDITPPNTPNAQERSAKRARHN